MGRYRLFIKYQISATHDILHWDSSSMTLYKKNNKTCFFSLHILLYSSVYSNFFIYGLYNQPLTDTAQYVFSLENLRKPLSSEKSSAAQKVISLIFIAVCLEKYMSEPNSFAGFILRVFQVQIRPNGDCI